MLQYFAIPLLLRPSFLSGVMSSLLYIGSCSYYHYMNVLGYSALPYLERTEIFFWPIPVFVLSLPFMIISGFNPSRFALGLFFGDSGYP